MKTVFLLLVALFTMNIANAQNVNIPDANFKTALLAIPGIDLNHDGTIQVSEAAAFTGGIDVSFKHVSDLTGIEAFTKITSLDCSYNSFTGFNISSNKALTTLNCCCNQLTNLDVTANTALTGLYCYVNQIKSLDLSANKSLTALDCFINQITSLDLSANTALTELSCYNNQLLKSPVGA